jgi:CubicO group peptidase (beta-lactamase class C family)
MVEVILNKHLKRLEDVMKRYVDRGVLPHISTSIVSEEGVLHRFSYGYHCVESGSLIDDDAIFRMYSSTKMVTSVGLMILFEKGFFSLDDPLADYMPEFSAMTVLISGANRVDQVRPADEPIRIRHLLSHTAGLSYGQFDPSSYIDQLYQSSKIQAMGNSDLDLVEFCKQVAQMPLASEPGREWRYSIATDVCGRLIEILAGERLDVFLNENIFKPLEMGDTGFSIPASKVHRLPKMYQPTEMNKPLGAGLTEMENELDQQYLEQPRFLSGGGGLVSTMGDFSNFVSMLLNEGKFSDRRILAPATLSLMRKDQLAKNAVVRTAYWKMASSGFGLGFAIRRYSDKQLPPEARGEYYWGGLAGTHTWLCPKLRVGGLCFTQRMPGFWHLFSHDFQKLWYRAILAR